MNMKTLQAQKQVLVKNTKKNDTTRHLFSFKDPTSILIIHKQILSKKAIHKLAASTNN